VDSEGKRWVFSTQIVSRRDGPVLRGEYKTPCQQPNRPPCPKISPERAAEFELSPKNLQAIEHYRVTQACCGANLTERERTDEVTQRNLSIIHQLHEAHKQTQSLKAAVVK